MYKTCVKYKTYDAFLKLIKLVTQFRTSETRVPRERARTRQRMFAGNSSKAFLSWPRTKTLLRDYQVLRAKTERKGRAIIKRTLMSHCLDHFRARKEILPHHLQ